MSRAIDRPPDHYMTGWNSGSLPALDAHNAPVRVTYGGHPIVFARSKDRLGMAAGGMASSSLSYVPAFPNVLDAWAAHRAARFGPRDRGHSAGLLKKETKSAKVGFLRAQEGSCSERAVTHPSVGAPNPRADRCGHETILRSEVSGLNMAKL